MSTTTPDLKGVNIFLIGMMGSGKSTTGESLANLLNYQFFDTDSVVEQFANQSITEIFEQSGEDTFRKLETQVLAELSSYRRLVVATGGGIILKSMNWSYLRHGLVIWLDVAPQILWKRLQEDDTRPLLQTSDPYATLQEKIDQREKLYQQADVVVSVTENLDLPAVCQKIFDAIQAKLRTDQTAATQS